MRVCKADERGNAVMSSVDELQKVIDDSHRIVFFGGAGVSTESGRFATSLRSGSRECRICFIFSTSVVSVSL